MGGLDLALRLAVVAYAVLTAAALALWRQQTAAMFAIAATALLLLFIGIHNAWDSVTHIGLNRRTPES